MMKISKIYRQILNEIGNSSEVPPNAKFTVGQHSGKIGFKFMDDDYSIEIRVPIMKDDDPSDILMALTVDFDTNNGDYKLTNKGNPLKVMGYVVGSIEGWLLKYLKKFGSGKLQIAYIKFNPKSEDSEIGSTSSGEDDNEGRNKRDRLYRMFIDKFAKKHGVGVTYSTTAGIIAIFNPKLIIN